MTLRDEHEGKIRDANALQAKLREVRPGDWVQVVLCEIPPRIGDQPKHPMVASGEVYANVSDPKELLLGNVLLCNQDSGWVSPSLLEIQEHRPVVIEEPETLGAVVVDSDGQEWVNIGYSPVQLDSIWAGVSGSGAVHSLLWRDIKHPRLS